MFDVAINDIRFAFRQLAKHKGFTITAAVTLALGIGANTAIFTLVNGVMLKSLPVADPERLVRLGDTNDCCVVGGFRGRLSIFAYPLYTYLRDHTPEFEELAAFQAGLGKVGVRQSGGAAAPEPFVDQFVSGNYFSMFGIRPFAGRLLSPTDDTHGAPPVAVMSYRAWQHHYGADSSVIGSTFIIDGAPFTIAGIAPPGFFGDTVQPDPPDFWMPLADEPFAHPTSSLLAVKDQHWLYVIGRVRPGTQIPRLESEVNVGVRQWFLANLPPVGMSAEKSFERQHVALTPAGGGVTTMKENYEHDLRLLMYITGLVLLITCANLANLQLARGASSSAQTAIRVALGAPRFRLIRQTLTESVLLAVGGGAAGLLVAVELARLMVRFAFHAAHYVPIDFQPSLPVLGFTFLLSLATGVAFGVAPAWSASRADPASALHGAGRSTRHSSLPQKSLVVLQAALALVLLAGAGLMVETLRHLQDQQFGFRMDGAKVVNVHAGIGGYSPEKLATLYRDLQRKLAEIPGVRNAALMLYSPMSGNNWQSGVSLEERPNRMVSPAWDRVSPGFFQTLGARMMRGREFDERDTPDATHVAVVNQEFANKLFPGEDPIGKRFGLGGVQHSADYQIVGVSSNVLFRNPREPIPPPMFFLPLLQMWKSEWADSGKARSNQIHNIVLRVAGNPPNLTARVQSVIAAADPNLTMLSIVDLQDALGDLLQHERLLAKLGELFGLLALLLASVGLYGVTAYSVSRRTSEIGIRTAIGANRLRVVRMILSGALLQVAIGLALGFPAALAMGRLLAGQVYGVKTSDPVILGAAGLMLAASATVAGLIPALRAATIDPVIALRIDG